MVETSDRWISVPRLKLLVGPELFLKVLYLKLKYFFLLLVSSQNLRYLLIDLFHKKNDILFALFVEFLVVQLRKVSFAFFGQKRLLLREGSKHTLTLL